MSRCHSPPPNLVRDDSTPIWAAPPDRMTKTPSPSSGTPPTERSAPRPSRTRGIAARPHVRGSKTPVARCDPAEDGPSDPFRAVPLAHFAPAQMDRHDGRYSDTGAGRTRDLPLFDLEAGRLPPRPCLFDAEAPAADRKRSQMPPAWPHLALSYRRHPDMVGDPSARRRPWLSAATCRFSHGA